MVPTWRTLTALILILTILAVSCVAAQQAQFEIAGIRTLKEDGTPSTTFRRGEFVLVEVVIRRTDTYYYEIPEARFLVLVRATHEDVMWGLGAFMASLAAGQSITAIPAFRVPEDAPTGTWRIKVFVWSNWAKYGGVPLATPVETEITVTG